MLLQEKFWTDILENKKNRKGAILLENPQQKPRQAHHRF